MEDKKEKRLDSSKLDKSRKGNFNVSEDEILRRAEIVRKNRLNIALGAKPKDVYDWW